MAKNHKAFDVSTKDVLSIVIPVTISSMTTPLIGITDTAVIGQLDDVSMLGGLAVSAMIFSLLFNSLNFLRSSTTGLTAQAVGAEDNDEQVLVLIRSLLVSVFLGSLLLLFSIQILDFSLLVIHPSEMVEESVKAYFLIRILSAPLVLVNYSILGWLIGLGRASQGGIIQVLANGMNIVLSIYLGLTLDYGIQGVAWGTVISEGVAVLLGIFYIAKNNQNFSNVSTKNVFDKDALTRLFLLNGDILIRSFSLLFAFSFFTAQSANMGDVTLAANSVLMHFLMFSSFILDGFATATQQMVGKALGARYLPAFDKVIRINLIWSFVLSLVLFAGLYGGGEFIISLLTVHTDVRLVANQYLIWAALSGVFGVLAFQMDGVFIGTTWSKDMRNMMIVSLIIYLFAWWSLVPVWGNHGLWIAFEIFLTMRGLTLFFMLPLKRKKAFLA